MDMARVAGGASEPGLPLTEAHTFDVHLETASGSRYRVTWDGEGVAGTLTREPAQDPDVHPLSMGLRRDGDAVALLGFDRLDVGHPTTFLIDVRGDGVLTARWANATVWIAGEGWTADLS